MFDPPSAEACAIYRKRSGEKAERFLSFLPQMVAVLEDRWQIKTGRFLPGGMTSYVCSVETTSGSAVLKLLIDPERVRKEADALMIWDGCGAVQLQAVDDQLGALLLDDLRPCKQLNGDRTIAEQAELFSSIAKSIHRPLTGHPSFDDFLTKIKLQNDGIVERWQALDQPLSKSDIALRLSLSEELLARAFEPKLLHGDLHGGNILVGGSAVAIDPQACHSGDVCWEAAYWAVCNDMQAFDGCVGERLEALADYGFPLAETTGWAFAIAVDKLLFHRSLTDERGQGFQRQLDACRALL